MKATNGGEAQQAGINSSNSGRGLAGKIHLAPSRTSKGAF
jgi:hypothetical protein